MYNNQESSQRGRNYNRGGRRPSRSQQKRGVGRTVGFFNPERIKQEEDKLEQTRIEVNKTMNDAEDVKLKQQSSPDQSKRNSKINKTVELGKEFVSKIFKGFLKPERGNVKVTLDETMDSRLTAQYSERIHNYMIMKMSLPTEAEVKSYIDKFKSITNVAIACKLYHSANSEAQKPLYTMFALRLSTFPLPRKMALIINQLGKTDLLCDNHIRVREQNLVSKKFACKAILYWYGEKIKPYLKTGRTFDEFNLVLFNNWDTMIDKTLSSVKILKQKGKQFFLDQVNKPYEFKMAQKIYKLKLPDFEFKKENTVDEVLEYFNNALFADFEFDKAEIYKLIGTLVFQVAEFDWFDDPTKKLKELEPKFTGSFIAEYEFSTLLAFSKIWFLETFIKPKMLNDLIGEIVTSWTNTYSPEFNLMFDMDTMKFTEYGTDAQLIQMEDFEVKKDVTKENWKSIASRARARTMLRTTEHGATIGLSMAYSKKVEFSSKFEVSYDNNASSILGEILATDFIKK